MNIKVEHHKDWQWIDIKLKNNMAKDIKLYKDGHEVTINETQLDNFLELGYKQEKDKQVKSKKKENKTWQHITEKKE